MTVLLGLLGMTFLLFLSWFLFQVVKNEKINHTNYDAAEKEKADRLTRRRYTRKMEELLHRHKGDLEKQLECIEKIDEAGVSFQSWSVILNSLDHDPNYALLSKVILDKMETISDGEKPTISRAR